MKKTMFSCGLLSGLFFIVCSGYAQTLPEIELTKIAQVSPNAASLGKYGEYPVGLYTGIPSINIPFYEINAGRIKVPVGISYNAGGIKVEEIASSVGLGWALNAGGVITRSVRGAPDEIATPGESSFFTTTKTVDSLKHLFALDPMGSQATQKKVAGGKIDAEPDVFYYNFGGVSGKFMYHQNDGKFYSIPYNKLKIEFTNSFGGVTSFTITDESGIIYHFDEMEVSTRENATLTVSSTTAWYLSTIEDPLSGQSVNFTYAHDILNYTTLGSSSHYFNIRFQGTNSSKMGVSHSVTSLRAISFATGSVKFQRGMARCDLIGDSAITEIKVFDINNRLVKDYDLNYEYFYDNSSVSCSSNSSQSYAEQLRLKLLSVSEYSIDGNHNNPKTHSFEYNSGLPSRLSFGQDHWGFFNGATGNPALYPPYTYTYSNPTLIIPLSGGNRNVNPIYSIAGSLNKITYPTKGYTTFELEGNTVASSPYEMLERPRSVSLPLGTSDYGEGEFSMVANSSNLVHVEVTGFDPSYLPSGYPGFWIKVSIENLDTVGVGDGDIFWVGDGKISNLDPVNFYLPNGNYKIIIDCVGNPYPDSYQNTAVNISWTDHIENVALEDTKIGGLRIKKIKNYDESGNLTTMKYYKYVKESNPSVSSGETQFSPRYFSTVNYMPHAFSTGSTSQADLPTLSLKRASQSSYPLVDESGKSVGYSNVIELNGEDDTNGYTQYKFTNFSDASDTFSGVYSFSRPISLQWLRGLETERKVFRYNGSANELLSSVVNEYDTTLLAGQKKTFEGIRGGFKYYWDDDATELYWPEEDYYFLGAVLPLYEYYPVYSDFIYLKKTTERLYNGSNYIETVKNYTYSPKNLRPSVESTIGSDGQELALVTKYPLDYTVGSSPTPPKSQAIFKLQDMNNINVPIEQYSYKVLPSTDKLLTGANFYSYRSNAALLDTVFSYELPSGPVTNYAGLTATPSTFSKASAYKPAVIFDDYDDKSNLLQQHKADGPPISYLYDYSNTYPVAEVTGAAQGDIAYTSFEDTGTGNWTYSGTISTDATAPTGRKAYSLTISNTVSRTGLSSGKTYVLSYWAKNTSSASISGTTAAIVDSRNGWSRYECVVTGVTSITLSGTVALDEVRLYPQGALMTTSTYDPLVGITSHTDPKGMTTYYRYDGSGRLENILDQNGDIVKNYSYHYKSIVFGNDELSQSFTRNNCSPGDTGGQVTYTIPAGTYTSTESKAAANALASAAIATLGQAYANANATCTTPCTGDDKKIINGVCETGVKVYTSSLLKPSGTYQCHFHYLWSDESQSQEYVENGMPSPCIEE